MLNQNIAFVGYMGCGKTTCAKYLQEHCDYNIYSFAKSVKHAVELYLERPYNKKDDREFIVNLGEIFKISKNELTLRDKQFLLSFIRKNEECYNFYKANLKNIHHADCWINTTFSKDYFKGASERKVVIDDMRFMKEAINFRMNGGIIIMLDVNKNVIKQRLIERDGIFKKSWLDSISERQWQNINVDMCIWNAHCKTTCEIIQEIENRINANAYDYVKLNSLMDIHVYNGSNAKILHLEKLTKDEFKQQILILQKNGLKYTYQEVEQ